MSIPELYQNTQPTLHRSDWIKAARTELLVSGIQNVQVRKISSALGVTTGAFYHVFKNLEELHNDLLNDWKVRNTEPFRKAITDAAPDGRKQLIAYDSIIVFEKDYDPLYDSMIREWSHISLTVKDALRQIDAERICLFQDIFINLGFIKKEAEIRAKVMYFHQIGYQTLRIEESLCQRLMNIPYYAEILAGGPQKYPFDDSAGVLKLFKEINEK